MRPVFGAERSRSRCDEQRARDVPFRVLLLAEVLGLREIVAYVDDHEGRIAEMPRELAGPISVV